VLHLVLSTNCYCFSAHHWPDVLAGRVATVFLRSRNRISTVILVSLVKELLSSTQVCVILRKWNEMKCKKNENIFRNKLTFDNHNFLNSILLFSLSCRLVLFSIFVCWEPCHHGMGRLHCVFWSRYPDMKGSYKILSNQSRTGDKEWSSSLGVVWGQTIPHPVLWNITQDLVLFSCGDL
jgi:hypothetical protein